MKAAAGAYLGQPHAVSTCCTAWEGGWVRGCRPQTSNGLRHGSGAEAAREYSGAELALGSAIMFRHPREKRFTIISGPLGLSLGHTPPLSAQNPGWEAQPAGPGKDA